ncbi:MAG: hypothetical protein IPL33_19650 [Sphingobacteriales bacterium]|nr:hypothetical protein [Sphingobacteriales bacterium]
MNKFLSFVALLGILLWASCHDAADLPGVGTGGDWPFGSGDTLGWGGGDTLPPCDTCHHHGGHGHGHHDSIPGGGLGAAGTRPTHTHTIAYPVAVALVAASWGGWDLTHTHPHDSLPRWRRFLGRWRLDPYAPA